ncbi:MAG: hypothetical protein IPL49_16890 [Saprospirales bacterium]|nr:hypothetical protein [Saprospirales bacterium]MBK8492511.1 hypothetical protein [Saprospirales bacterium]
MNLSHFKPDLFILTPVSEVLGHITGSNAKGIAVIAQLEEGTETAALELLSKILKSVELDNTKDTLLLKAAPSTRFSLIALCRQTGCHTFLLFGATPLHLGLQLRMEKYTPFEINGLKGLWADSLSELEPSRELKTALWSALKSLFPN